MVASIRTPVHAKNLENVRFLDRECARLCLHVYNGIAHVYRRRVQSLRGRRWNTWMARRTFPRNAVGCAKLVEFVPGRESLFCIMQKHARPGSLHKIISFRDLRFHGFIYLSRSSRSMRLYSRPTDWKSGGSL